MGEIYSDVEQTSDSIRSYEQALEQLSHLEEDELSSFMNYAAITYNMLGLSYVNRESYAQGIGCLAKAYAIYEKYRSGTF